MPEPLGVLNQAAHGIPAKEYAEILREKLPKTTVKLGETPADEREMIESAQVITGVHLTEEQLSNANELKFFACAAAGTDHLPMRELQSRNVAVTNASGVHGPNIGESVIGYLLAITRRFDIGYRQMERNEWRHFQSGELFGKTVTVVGLGAIGESVIERLQGFGVDIIGVRYTPEKQSLTERTVGFDSIQNVLPETDHLIICCRLTDATRGLIGQAELNRMPPDATLINVSRGEVVDTPALVDALQSNKLGAAALDVTDPEPLPSSHTLWDLGNVFITPHVSGFTPQYWERCADILHRNVEKIRDTGSYSDLENQVLSP